MKELPDCSVHLMVTSPPYNVGKEYDNDLTLEEYLAFLMRVWKETYRVLVPGRAGVHQRCECGPQAVYSTARLDHAGYDRPGLSDAWRDHLG